MLLLDFLAFIVAPKGNPVYERGLGQAFCQPLATASVSGDHTGNRAGLLYFCGFWWRVPSGNGSPLSMDRRRSEKT